MGVLLIDLSMNQLVFSYKHLISNVVLLGLYFLITFVGSTVQNRPVYANHLPFKGDYTNNYSYPDLKDEWAIERRQECKDYFEWSNIDGDNFSVPDW